MKPSNLEDKEDFVYQEIEGVLKQLLQTYFERGEWDDLVSNLVSDILANDSGLDLLKSPPAASDISKLLNELKEEELLSTYAE